MLQRKNRILLYLAALLATGCGPSDRELQLEKREKEIVHREQQLQLKEGEVRALLTFKDSILKVMDSVDQQRYRSWPDSLAGKWSSKIVCVESNCSEYVIGDLRSDNWEFLLDSNRLITKIYDKNEKEVRTYQAQYSKEGILLHFSTDSTAKKRVTMDVTIREVNSQRLKGERIVSVNNNCTARFNVELTRP